MITIRKSEDRGHANHGWLNAKHSFSFSDYFDRNHMGFRSLRVINEDVIEAGKGFPTHPHENMEIITYLVEGAIEHRDTIGSKGVIHPGEIQYMSAGSGIQHSEFNHYKDKNTHLLQIWIKPNEHGGAPRYGQLDFSKQLLEKNLVLTASPDGRENSIQIKQDAFIYAGKLKQNADLKIPLNLNRHAWVQIVKGNLILKSSETTTSLSSGDGVAISDESELNFLASDETEFLFFDLA